MVTGPTLTFKSADNPDSLYGEDVYGAIIDEASRCKPDAWYAVRSTLTATSGPAVCIGNVKGKRNWFYEWCRRTQMGLDPNANFSRITWRDAVDAKVLDEEEIDDARRNLPEKVFQELFEALASDDTGNPFGEDHILACVRPIDPVRGTALSPLPPVAFGVDLAKKQDYLVVIGLDENGDVCVFQRWTHVPWRESIHRIHELVGDYIPTLVDSTGVGDPVLEELQVNHGNFFGYNFSSGSKQRLMEGLAVSIQSREIGFPDGPIKNELMLFEYETTRTGVRYSAPEGYNDDCVCSLALARQKWAETAPGANLMEFWDRQIENQRRRQELEDLGVPDGIGREFENAIRQQLDPQETLNNELTEMYNAAYSARVAPMQRVCISCHKPIDGGSRISDGVYSWHVECGGPGAKINLFTGASGAPLH